MVATDKGRARVLTVWLENKMPSDAGQHTWESYLPAGVEEGPLWGGSDLLNNKNNKLIIGFAYGLLDSHLTCDSDTDETVWIPWVRKSFFPFPGRLSWSFQATGVCSIENDTFCFYLPHLYSEVWEQITHYFKKSINKNHQKLPVIS